MATMITPHPKEEVKAAGVAAIRKWYIELAHDYELIMNEKVKQCPVCGEWLKPETSYYKDDRYVSGYFYICKRCIQAMVEQRNSKNDIPNETKESVQRVLYLMDLAYLDDLYEQCVKGAEENLKEKNRKSPFSTYITCIKSLVQYKGKTWKDSEFPATDDDKTEFKPRDKIIEVFGEGFSSEDYLYLQGQYDDWCSRTQVDTKAQEMYVVQICLQSLEIYKDRRAGRDVTNKLKALDTLMSAANLQPRQNVSNAATDRLSLGQLIERWENEKPIPEPDPEFKDVDNIGKYLRVWFAGWLGKAVGLDNAYTKECEEEINKYTVDSNIEDEDSYSGDVYDALFGKPE